MSKDVNNSVAAGGKETRNALLVGLLLLLLLILAPLYWVERAQQDLTERSRAALRNGGLDPDAFEVGFDGRDARLVGSQAEAAQLSQARRLVKRVWGVRTVSSRATAAGAEPPAGSAASPPPKAANAAFGDGSGAAPTGNSAARPTAAGKSEQIAASPEPVTTPPPDPAPPPMAVAPQPEAVPAVEASPELPSAEPASEPAATEPVAAETVAQTTAAPVSEAQATRPPITSGPAISNQDTPAEPETAGPAQTEPQAPAETGPAGSALEAAFETAEVSAELTAANTAMEETGTPAPKETALTPEPLTQATDSREADASPPEPERKPIPDQAATPLSDDSGAAAGLDADALLIDWPDLAAVEDLRLEMQHNQVWLRGQVNSLADLRRIETQFPDSAAGRHVRLNLQLATRSSRELAEYLNLLAASFRFRAGTSHFGPAGQRAMDRIADTLKSYPGIRLGLAGRAPETVKPEVRRVHARHRAGATYRALLKRGVDGQQLFLADFASPFSPVLSHVPVAPSGPGQIQFFSLER